MVNPSSTSSGSREAQTNIDYFNECFDPQTGMSPEDFGQAFCRVCRNPECGRAKWGRSKWINRISTQVDRLLEHPRFADPQDTRFKGIRETDFPDMLRHAMQLEIADKRKDWEIPSEDDAMQMLGRMQTPPLPSVLSTVPERFVAPPPEPPPEPPQTHITSQIPKVPKPPVALPRAWNTVVPAGGLIVGGGPAPEIPAPPPKPVHDPWAIPQKPKNVIPVGGSVRMGNVPEEPKK